MIVKKITTRFYIRRRIGSVNRQKGRTFRLGSRKVKFFLKSTFVQITVIEDFFFFFFLFFFLSYSWTHHRLKFRQTPIRLELNFGIKTMTTMFTCSRFLFHSSLSTSGRLVITMNTFYGFCDCIFLEFHIQEIVLLFWSIL